MFDFPVNSPNGRKKIVNNHPVDRARRVYLEVKEQKLFHFFVAKRLLTVHKKKQKLCMSIKYVYFFIIYHILYKQINIKKSKNKRLLKAFI